jgi:ribosome-binding protein aMBF1 (putative translation factor)
MLAAAKTRPISLMFKPRTPRRVIQRVRKQYSRYLIENDERLVEWKKTDLHQELKKEIIPGVFLRLLREGHAWSQAALAEKLAISFRRVSDFETGQREISKDIAKKLALIFNVSPARFI